MEIEIFGMAGVPDGMKPGDAYGQFLAESHAMEQCSCLKMLP
jgi:hypothetical protein